MMSAHRIIPNLFIVGAPKCGTTAMHTYLGQHPDIFMANYTENNYFATDLIPLDDQFRLDENYFALFKDARDQKIIGEKSVYYLLSKIAAHNIHNFNPDAKIIIMLRNPVDMLQSFHAQQIYNTDEEITCFEDALNAENGRRNGTIKINDRLRIKGKLFYSEVVAYTEQVKRYLSLFNKDQVQIIIYDDLKKDTAAVYRNTLEFLNVDPTFKPDFPIINARKVIIRHTNDRKDKNAIVHFIKEIIKATISRQLCSNLCRPLANNELKADACSYPQYPVMDPLTRKQLQEKYRPEVERLSVLLGRDLSFWCKDVG